MVKQQCGKDGCKESAVYCEEHYFKLRRKLSNRNYTLLVLALGLLSVFLLVWFPLKDVDENKFCQEKVNKYFPEFKFENVYLSLNRECVGEVRENQINVKRDGLTLVEGKEEEQITKTFKLDEAGIRYLESDDLYGLMFLVGIFTTFMLFVVIKEWIMGL